METVYKDLLTVKIAEIFLYIYIQWWYKWLTMHGAFTLSVFAYFFDFTLYMYIYHTCNTIPRLNFKILSISY